MVEKRTSTKKAKVTSKGDIAKGVKKVIAKKKSIKKNKEVSIIPEKVETSKVLETFSSIEKFLDNHFAIFLIVYGYNEEIIDILNFMIDNGEHFWVLYFLLLAIFIVIAVMLKLVFFVLKIDVEDKAKAPRKVAHKTTAPKATTKKTTKKRTTKK